MIGAFVYLFMIIIVCAVILPEQFREGRAMVRQLEALDVHFATFFDTNTYKVEEKIRNLSLATKFDHFLGKNNLQE